MAALASIGGPITIGVGVAVAIGLAIWRLFGDTWQVRLAKRIHEEFEARDLLGLLRTQAAEYWEASARAFESGAEKTEQDFRDRLEGMRRMLAEPGKSSSEVEAKVESLKVLRDFFGGIPWYGV
jgi:hypothetical protein